MVKLQRFCFCLLALCLVTSIGLNVYLILISGVGFITNHASTLQLHTEGGFSTNFTFPSRKARIAYYMGDWYGATPTDIPCHEMIVAKESKLISDKAVSYSVRSLVKSIKAIKDWRVGAYLRCANDVINNGSMSDVERGDRRIILSVGDTHSRSSRLPGKISVQLEGSYLAQSISTFSPCNSDRKNALFSIRRGKGDGQGIFQNNHLAARSLPTLQVH